jgi:hypothetical protein
MDQPLAAESIEDEAAHLMAKPPGVGMGKKPAPINLKPGDVMTLGIEKLGTQRQSVRAWSRA